MRFVEIVIVVYNVLLLLVLDLAYLWPTSWMFGLGGVFGIGGFFAGYAISSDMSIAPRDFWRFPKFEIFKKKLAYGNSVAVITSLVVGLVICVICYLVTGKWPEC